ncbi:hypothetical protein FFT09_10145 [Saccharomonospora piscinae]|uniref:hypothetical protein n=1 Tax=Saccharomonospora piscinae TaxID=687388 RepID=UPI001106E8E2|nr:hypothetical protein [Saccharomonospora piscinae]TLW93716.1 hypothetical protein FFT09_10145 [Saccharomonospora piscinae]
MSEWNESDEPREPEPAETTTGAGEETAPDVLLDVPNLSVEEIDLEVENLRARVSVQAEVLELVKLHVGADVDLGRVSLRITGVQAEALLKVRLDRVAQIIERVLTTIDRNPDILEHVVKAAEPVLREAGGAVGELSAGGRRAVEDVGRGAGDAVGEVGRGAGGAVEDVGRGAGEAAGSAGEAVEDVAAGARRIAGTASGAVDDLAGSEDSADDEDGDDGETEEADESEQESEPEPERAPRRTRGTEREPRRRSRPPRRRPGPT